MKRTLRLPRLLIVGISAFAVALVAVQSAFADPRDFTLNNNSSVDLASVYVSPSDANAWGNDIMGTGLLPAGQSASVSFAQFDGSSCNYDIKVVGTAGQEGYLYKVDLCSVSQVSFS
jgi:hypothetical protein